MFFIIDSLHTLDRVYYYSMASFVTILKKGGTSKWYCRVIIPHAYTGMDRATQHSEALGVVASLEPAGGQVSVEQRVEALLAATTLTVFQYISQVCLRVVECVKSCMQVCIHMQLHVMAPPQGLFERHKLMFATQLCMAMSAADGSLQRDKFDFLLRGGRVEAPPNPLAEWLPLSAWQTAHAIGQARLAKHALVSSCCSILRASIIASSCMSSLHRASGTARLCVPGRRPCEQRQAMARVV